MQLINLITKIALIIGLLYFIDNYDLLNKIKGIVNGKTSIKETFNNVILPKEEAIKIFIPDQLPILNLGLTNKGSYLDEMSLYFRRHIFPTNPINTNGTIDNIFKLINKELDMAFVDEEILQNFMNNSNHIKSNFNLDTLPKINFSLLGVCDYQHFLFVSVENSGILKFEDIKNVKISTSIEDNNNTVNNSRKKRNVRIGVLNKNNADYYHLLKILYLSNINRNEDVDIQIYNNYNELGNALYSQLVDVIYLTTNEKNKMLFELTKAVKCRYISTKIGREEYLYNRPEDLQINTYFNPPFMMKKQLYNSLSPSPSFSSKLKNNNNNNNNNNSNSRLTNMFSDEITFGCHMNDKREFRELLELLSYKIPVDNTIENIINNQTYFINTEEELKDIMDNINYKIIIFLPQNQQNRAIIETFFPDKDNYKNLDLSMNKRFNKRLEAKTARLISEYKTRDSLIKNKFHVLFDKTLNLNTSYRNINTSSTLETYSTRLLLVCRNDIESKYVEQIVENYIKHLRRLQNNINKYLSSYSIENENSEQLEEEIELEEENRTMYNSYVPDAFNFQEQVSVKDIPIHKSASKIYEKYNLIKTVSIDETPVDY